MCHIFQSTESSRFFVYCEVSINLFLLSCILTVQQVIITFLTALTGVHRSVFVAAASPRSRQTGDFLSGKFLVLPQQRSLVLRDSVLQEELELYQGITESYRLESLFYLHTSFNKHLLTCPVVKPQTAFPKKQRSSKFRRSVPGKGGATVCSAASGGVWQGLGQTPSETCKVKWEFSCLLEQGLGREGRIVLAKLSSLRKIIKLILLLDPVFSWIPNLQ